ncbi:MAG: Rrf2 family transcriptional regulator [Scytolyngbya sp. HA4215-MV1]|jgi:Rrf2 family protein|nr:Rrf2 family transcriptional regulator [Scytolyngbya sp. HA4215-MV1]
MSLNHGNPRNTLSELSAKAQYALLALIELAGHPDPKNPLTINEISARQLIPERYLEQIFTLLRRGGVLQSQRGARGGYTLSKEPWQITVLEVITLVEGDRRNRMLGASWTVEQEMIHEIWQQASTAFQTALSQHTLQDLCQRRDIRKQNNPMYYI